MFSAIHEQMFGWVGDLRCIAYLDDILIYGQTFEEHLENLEAVLNCLNKKRKKLNAAKCHFFKREVKYLGRLISKDGYRADLQDSIALEKFYAPPKLLVNYVCCWVSWAITAVTLKIFLKF